MTAQAGRADGPRHGHAVVIGASVAGLLAARALVDHFEQVTIVERDELPNGPVFRAGVPQSRHLHVLLGRGLDLYSQLFPGFEAAMVAAGAPIVAWHDALWLNAAGWSRRYPSTIRLLGASRELLEWQLRTRVTDRGVQVLTRRDVVGLLASSDHSAVTGVQVLPRPSTGEAVQDLPAALIVDASGRSSKASDWLATLGYPLTTKVKIDAFLGYASRRYRIPEDLAADWRMLVLPPAPPSTRGGVIFPIEDNQWLVTLGGYGRDYPPTDDEAAFLAFAKDLRSPLLHQAIRNAEPLSEIRGWQQTANLWRRFERFGRWPEGFIAVGDAVRAFNPVYGQGMTVAAITAVALDRALSDHRHRHGDDLAGFARPFQRLVASHSADAWQLSTGEDLRYESTEGPRPGRLGRLAYRYADRVLAVANGNHDVQAAFLRVIHLQDRPAALFRPRVLLPVLAGRHAERLEDPPTASVSRQPA